MIAWVLVGAYVVYAIWWQYEYVLPPILNGQYTEAFNLIMGVNPAFLFYLALFSCFFYAIGTVLVWFRYAWVKLFGD